ncbi:TadE family protein [Altericroceibacterium spongiae]|uniref:TadE family protein n=1 Tax=Altericroceibacterium spongiae TaxID=2320269 RepID=UPI0016013C3F|nr:TadE family protein [Altericroceibacterium spongiae]
MEFALIAPVFFLMLFGIIEISRMVWTSQTLDEVAYSTARCMSLETGCTDASSQRSYARNRAAHYGVGLTDSDIALSENTMCKGYAGANEVSISLAFVSPVTGFVPGLDTTLNATACYPVMAS